MVGAGLGVGVGLGVGLGFGFGFGFGLGLGFGFGFGLARHAPRTDASARRRSAADLLPVRVRARARAKVRVRDRVTGELSCGPCAAAVAPLPSSEAPPGVLSTAAAPTLAVVAVGSAASGAEVTVCAGCCWSSRSARSREMMASRVCASEARRVCLTWLGLGCGLGLGLC